MTETVAEKGQKSKGNEPMPQAGEPTASEATRARDARARDEEIVTDRDDTADDAAPAEGVEALLDLWMDEAKATAARIWAWLAGDRGLLREHPAPLADLLPYWLRAPMAGNSTFLRWVQRIDGFTVGLFFTSSGYSWAWIGQKPLRRYCFLLLAFIVWRFS